MIQANELRIGNCVQIENIHLPETRGEIYSVTGIELRNDTDFPNSKSVIRLKKTNGYRTYNQFDQFIEPIPLTKELLLRLGFEQDKADNFCYEKANLNISVFSNLIIKGIVGDDGEITEIHSELKYVHQLQNLYWCLVGQELTLKK